MYDILKNVINRKDFDLSAMTAKIDKLWIENRLTDTQRDELLNLARNGADANNSVDVYAKLAELEARIRKIESGETSSDAENSDEFSEFVVGKWYYLGDKCSFEGVNYVCIAPEGIACVWSPKDYPTYWEVATDVC